MAASVVALALLAAVLHAAWNVMVKTSGDPLSLSAKAVLFGAVGAAPFVLTAWIVTGRPGFPTEALFFVVQTTAYEILYFVFLSAAYVRGDLAATYPVARGTAPVLAVFAGTLLLG